MLLLKKKYAGGRVKNYWVCLTNVDHLVSGGSCRSVVSKPVNASRAVVGKVVANEAVVACVESVHAAGLVVSSLVLGLLADLGLSARVHVVLLADEATVALGGLPHLRGVVPASVAKFGGFLRANVGGAGGEKVNFLAEVVLVPAFRFVGSEEVALLAGVATFDSVLLAHVGAERSVPGDFTVKARIALSVVAGLSELTKLGHVLLEADSRRPGSVVGDLAVHSAVALVTRCVSARVARTLR